MNNNITLYFFQKSNNFSYVCCQNKNADKWRKEMQDSGYSEINEAEYIIWRLLSGEITEDDILAAIESFRKTKA